MASVLEKIKELEDFKIEIDNEVFSMVYKAMASNDPMQMMDAATFLNKDANKRNKSTFLIDPLELSSGFGFREKRYTVSYNTLLRMSKTPIINAIIKTRINQIASFSIPQPDRHNIGFIIRKKSSYSKLNIIEKTSKEDEDRIEELTNFIINCGRDDVVWLNDDFDTFLRMIAHDSFVYDQMNFEVVRDKSGKPVQFFAVDAATIRISELLSKEDIEKRNIKMINGYYPSTVQIHENSVVNEYYPWEMCFGVRNPTTNINKRGYGTSELEELITIVTSLLWSEEYNRRFFSQGSSPKGIIRVKGGGLNDETLKQFRQQWNASMAGVENAWKTPIMNAENADWIDLQKSNRDMEFSVWIEFLIKVACAVYSIDPAEVNFPYSSSDNKPLFEGNNESRLKFSKDKGLRPPLKMIEQKINKYIIKQFYNGLYEFKFVGLDSLSLNEDTDLSIKQVTNFKTLNEIRREWNLEEIEGGDIILSPAYLQKLQMDQAEIQALLQQEMAMSEEGQESSGGANSDSEKPSKESETKKSEFEELFKSDDSDIKSHLQFLLGE